MSFHRQLADSSYHSGEVPVTREKNAEPLWKVSMNQYEFSLSPNTVSAAQQRRHRFLRFLQTWATPAIISCCDAPSSISPNPSSNFSAAGEWPVGADAWTKITFSWEATMPQVWATFTAVSMLSPDTQEQVKLKKLGVLEHSWQRHLSHKPWNPSLILTRGHFLKVPHISLTLILCRSLLSCLITGKKATTLKKARFSGRNCINGSMYTSYFSKLKLKNDKPIVHLDFTLS